MAHRKASLFIQKYDPEGVTHKPYDEIYEAETVHAVDLGSCSRKTSHWLQNLKRRADRAVRTYLEQGQRRNYYVDTKREWEVNAFNDSIFYKVVYVGCLINYVNCQRYQIVLEIAPLTPATPLL